MKNKKAVEQKNIYVVGFPKSGNTWLVRMLARALKAKVVKYAMDNITPEVAADINKEIKISSKYRISKIHFIPKRFLEKFKITKNDRIVYIKRNIYDVLVSSFFYFRYRGDERYILKTPSLEIILNPLKLHKYLKSRHTFSRYIQEFCMNGHKDHGKWKDHIYRWSEFINKNKNIKSTTTSYESLINNTKSELLNILRDLEFNNIDRKTIQEAAKEESFIKRKKEILSSQENKTFGKDFNIRFLRKGKSGDYKRFLNTRQIKYINSFLKGVF